MAIIAHLKDEYTGLKSTAFLSVEEIDVLIRFLIGVGTRVEMENAYSVQCDSHPTPQEFVKKLDGKIDKNSLDFTPTIRRVWCDTGDIFNMHHNFELNDTRRSLLSGYHFGKYGEALLKGVPYETDGYNANFVDLQIFIGDRQVFDSTSHEYYAAADLDGLEEKFNSYGNMPELTAGIIRKLNYTRPPEFVVGCKALVTLSSGKLIVETDGVKVVFEFCADDNDITFNTGYLGGTPKYTDANMVLTGASPCDFVSEKKYTIDDIIFNTDVQGVTNLKNSLPTFCDLYIELIAEDGSHCDIEIESPYIYVIEK